MEGSSDYVAAREPRSINYLHVLIAFSAPYILHYLLHTALRLLLHHRDELLYTLSWLLADSWTWFNFLPVIPLFLAGVLLNITIKHIGAMGKNTVLKISIAAVIVMVALDQLVQLLFSRHETFHAELLGGWLVVAPVLVSQMPDGVVSMGMLPPFVRLAMVLVFIPIIITIFRLLNNFCVRKAQLFASAVFLTAGYICSIFVTVLHIHMIYDYICIGGRIVFNIMDVYLWIGTFLILQTLLANYKDLNKLKTADVLAFFKDEYKRLKERCAGFLKAGGLFFRR